MGDTLWRLSRPAIATVKHKELSLAFEFVSSGAPMEHRAYVSLDSGKIYWISELIPIQEEEIPDDEVNVLRSSSSRGGTGRHDPSSDPLRPPGAARRAAYVGPVTRMWTRGPQ